MADSLAVRLVANEETKFNASAGKNITRRGRNFYLQKFLTGLAELEYFKIILPQLVSCTSTV